MLKCQIDTINTTHKTAFTGTISLTAILETCLGNTLHRKYDWEGLISTRTTMACQRNQCTYLTLYKNLLLISMYFNSVNGSNIS